MSKRTSYIKHTRGHSATKTTGFAMRFENGFEVSVQWSPEHYSSARLEGYDGATANTAEVAVFNPDGSWMLLHDYTKDEYFKPQTDVLGWATPDVIAEIIHVLQSASDDSNWGDIGEDVRFIVAEFESGDKT